MGWTMKTFKAIFIVPALLICMCAASCAGPRAGSVSQWTYPMQKIYSASEPEVWSAVVQTLPQMGFIIQTMDTDSGIIFAIDDIRRDAYSFLSGIPYLMEVRISEVTPGVTLVSIEYPQIRGILHDRVTWDPEADMFDYIQAHMDLR